MKEIILSLEDLEIYSRRQIRYGLSSTVRPYVDFTWSKINYIRCQKKDVIEEDANSLPSSSPNWTASTGESSRYLRDPKPVHDVNERINYRNLWDSWM